MLHPSKDKTFIKAIDFRMLKPGVRYSLGNKPQVIVIKGFPGLWRHDDLLKYFKEKNISACILDFGLQVKSIRSYTKKLDSFVKENEIINPVIVGFSMGGIIAVDYANKSSWKNIDKVVSIATPFKGVRAMKYAPFLPLAKDLKHNSKLIKQLSEIVPPKDKLVCIYGSWDQYFDVEKDEGTIKGATSYKLDVMGHRNAHMVKHLSTTLDKIFT